MRSAADASGLDKKFPMSKQRQPKPRKSRKREWLLLFTPFSNKLRKEDERAKPGRHPLLPPSEMFSVL
jgi:hypothetical protein